MNSDEKMDKEGVEDTQEPESFQEVAKKKVEKKEEKKEEKKVDEEDNIQSLIVTQSEITSDNEMEETSAATVE